MKKIVLILLIAIVASLQVKATDIYEILDDVKFDKSAMKVTATLFRPDSTNDNRWELVFFGYHELKNPVLLIKTCSGETVTPQTIKEGWVEVSTGWGNNPETGEPVEYKGAEVTHTFYFSDRDMWKIVDSGIAKIRFGSDGNWCEASWKRNEWGKSLSKGYRLLKEKMSPDYVPPKKPSIYDGF